MGLDFIDQFVDWMNHNGCVGPGNGAIWVSPSPTQIQIVD